MADPIPSVPRSAAEHGRSTFDKNVKSNLERITGLRNGELETLSDDAVLADVIVKINEILARMQG